MDVAPRVDRLLARAVEEQVNEQRSLRKALETLVARVARVEQTTTALDDTVRPWSDPGAATADLALRVEERFGQRLDDLEARLDELAVAIEDRAVETLSSDFAAVTDELRKAVGELGRMLLRDRGRISHTLTEHRNAILAELRLRGIADAPAYEDDDEEEDDRAFVRPRLLRRLRVE
jgi:hypothetical protein